MKRGTLMGGAPLPLGCRLARCAGWFVLVLAVTAVFARGMTVAVAPFAHEDFRRNDPATALAISTAVQAGIEPLGHYPFVERAEVDRLIHELSFGVSGLSAPATAPSLGRMLKADVLLRGRVVTRPDGKNVLRLETIELARAEVVATAQVELGAALEHGHLAPIAGADLQLAIVASAKMLDETEAVLATRAKRVVIKPLFFENNSVGQRLDGSDQVIQAALERAAQGSGTARILSLQRPLEAASESELVLLGLVEADPDAWERVADCYVWGSYTEKRAAGVALPDVDVELTATVWNGTDAPKNVSAAGKVRNLPQVADELAHAVLAASQKVASRLNASGAAPRKQVAALIADRAEKLRPTEVTSPTAVATSRSSALLRVQAQMLSAAVFFAPEDKRYWEQLMVTRRANLPSESSAVALADRARYVEDVIKVFDRFLVASDGSVDLDLLDRLWGREKDAYLELRDSFDYAHDDFREEYSGSNLQRIHANLDTAYRDWLRRTTEALVTRHGEADEAMARLGATLLLGSLHAGTSASDRAAVVGRLLPRWKPALFAYRAWYPNNTGFLDEARRAVREYIVSQGKRNALAAFDRLDTGELAAAEKAPPPRGSKAATAQESIARLQGMIEQLRRAANGNGPASARDNLAASIRQQQEELNAERDRAMAFLRSHATDTAPAPKPSLARTFEPAGEAPRFSSSDLRKQAAWLRENAAQRAKEGFPDAVLARMRRRADDLERDAMQRDAAAALPTATVTLGAHGSLLQGPYTAAEAAALDAAYQVKLPARFASLAVIPLPASAWELRDRDEPWVGGSPVNRHRIDEVVAVDDDLWILGAGRLWHHRPAEGLIEDAGARLGIASRVLSLLKANGSLWIGTLSEGVWRVDPRTLQATHFGLNDGLLSLRVGQLTESAGLVLAVEQAQSPGMMFRSPDLWRLAPGERKLPVSQFEAKSGKWTAFDPFNNDASHGLKAGIGIRGAGNVLLLSPGSLILNPASGLIQPLKVNRSALYRGFSDPTLQSLELVDRDSVWLGSAAAILQVDPSSAKAYPVMVTPAFSHIASDGRYVFAVRPAHVGGGEVTSPNDTPFELFVFDRERSAWIGRATFAGVVSTITVDAGHVWIGCSGSQRPLLEVDEAQLIDAMTSATPEAKWVREADQAAPQAETPNPAVSPSTLFAAAWAGDVAEVTRRLNAGANPNEATSTGWTALHAAVRNGRAAAAGILIAHGAKVDVSDVHGWYPLGIAVERDDRVLYDLLRTRGKADVNFAGPERGPVGDQGVLRALPPHQAVLHIATHRGYTDFVHELLVAGANPNQPDADGASPTLLAQRSGNHDLVAVFAHPNAPVQHRVTATVEGTPGPVAADVIAAVRLLDPVVADREFTYAGHTGDGTAIDRVLDRGAPLEAAGGGAVAAMAAEQWQIVDQLQARGFDPARAWPVGRLSLAGHEFRGTVGELLLGLALQQGRAEMVRALRAKGISFSQRSEFAAYTLGEVVQCGRIDLAEVAVQSGADPRVAVSNSFSPLYHAIRLHDLAMVKLLLGAGDDPTRLIGGPGVQVRPLGAWQPADFEPHPLPRAATAAMVCASEDWLEGSQVLANAFRPDNGSGLEFESVFTYEKAKSAAVRAVWYRADLRARGRSDAETEFLTAIVAGDAAKISAMARQPRLAETRGLKGESVLGLAIDENNAAAVTQLLHAGLSVDLADDNGETPLVHAARHGDIALAQDLLHRGAAINGRAGALRPLDVAIRARHADMALLLLRAGASQAPNELGNEEVIPLFQAVVFDLSDVTQYLVAHGADVSQRSRDGLTIGFPAARSNDPQMFDFLLKAGADVHAQSSQGWTPLVTAVRWGAVESVRKLLALGVRDAKAADYAVRFAKDIEPPDRPNDEALRSLPYTPDYRAVLDLMEGGGQIANSREAQDTLFWNEPHTEAEIDTYLARGGNVNYRGAATPLQSAIRNGNAALAKHLLAKGANPNLYGDGESELPLALASDQPDVVEALFKSGARPNWVLEYGWVPPESLLAHVIARRPPPETIRLFVAYGADLDLPGKGGVNAWRAVENLSSYGVDRGKIDALRAALTH